MKVSLQVNNKKLTTTFVDKQALPGVGSSNLAGLLPAAIG